MSFFNSIWDSLTGYDAANADKAAAADAAIQAQNPGLYGPGGKYYTPGNWESVQLNRTMELADGGYGQDNQREQINAAAADGLNQGIANVRNTISTILGKLFSILPWYVWAAAAVALFLYLGGGIWLRRLAGGRK